MLLRWSWFGSAAVVDPHAKGNKADDLDKQQNKEVDVVPALKLLLRIGRAAFIGCKPPHKAKVC